MAVRPKDTRPHVIVVEDEQFQRETLVDFLSENGYRTSGVDSGNALRRLVEKDPPALVLLDLRLPGGEDGFTLARFLRDETEVAPGREVLRLVRHEARGADGRGALRGVFVRDVELLPPV